jgi:hypothetical protein
MTTSAASAPLAENKTNIKARTNNERRMTLHLKFAEKCIGETYLVE